MKLNRRDSWKYEEIPKDCRKDREKKLLLVYLKNGYSLLYAIEQYNLYWLLDEFHISRWFCWGTETLLRASHFNKVNNA